MKFCFDENLSVRLARGLREFGEDVVHVVEEFGPGLKDIELIPKIAEKKWVLFTQDVHIHRHVHERRAYREAGLGVFALSAPKLSSWDQTKLVVKMWDLIKEKALGKRRPYVIKLTMRGRFHYLDP